jgi:23S rRNA pseudouridine1911/1915/1917 synthase
MLYSKGPNGVIHFLAEEPSSAFAVLEKLGLSAPSLFKIGAVFLNRKRLENDSPLKEGDTLRIHSMPRRFPTDKVDWQRRLVHIDPEFLIVDKPSGIPSIPTVDNQSENALHSLSAHLGEKLLVTHRLDHATSGLICFARTAKFQSWFNRRLIKRQITKVYSALTRTAPTTGLWTHFLEASDRAPKTMAREPTDGALICQTRVEKITPIGEDFEVCLSPLTGRTHQLRAQLCTEGSPILGDTLYGGENDDRFTNGSIALHAWKLQFADSKGGSHHFETPARWHLPAWPERSI